jgi:exodeoxyribonuclease-3
MQPETREAYAHLLAQGWIDDARHLHPYGRKELYTFWVDEFAFRRNAGFRMDFLLLSPGVAERLVACGVDAAQRGREKPSDHAPVWVRMQ